ncbi:MAG: type I methionyl aminopeptidase [Bacteriovoracaceae bacterium]|nr:type I methionyl aminopeptidase [Bacteriovoracaceae bacterium]
MSIIKTKDQIKRMRESGLIVWEAHSAVSKMIEPGVTTRELDAVIEDLIIQRKAIPLFKGVPGVTPYPNASCISINEEVVHGIPSNRKLSEGDVVSIDIGVKFNNWCGDSAVTYPVGQIDPDLSRLLTLTEDILRQAIIDIAKQKYWRFVARDMSKTAHDNGFSVVDALVGHNIGKQMWEGPQIPNFYDEKIDFKLQKGMVMAIEPMINVGTKEVKTLDDGWTIVTADGKVSAHFEHTVAFTDDGPKVLTMGPACQGWSLPSFITDLD